MGEEGGVNLYGFVGNNPVNAVDPHGEFLIQGLIALVVLAVIAGEIIFPLLNPDLNGPVVTGPNDEPVIAPQSFFPDSEHGGHHGAPPVHIEPPEVVPPDPNGFNPFRPIKPPYIKPPKCKVPVRNRAPRR